MSHIVNLRTNVKGETRAYELGSKTIVIGANASGKSAIAQSIELALTGSVTNEAGKAFAQGLKLMSLHPLGEGTLEVIGNWSDNAVSLFQLTGTQAQAKRPTHSTVQMENPLPFAQWKNVLAKEADTVRLALLEALSGPISVTIPAPFTSGAPIKVTSITELVKLVDTTDGRLRNARKVLKEMQATIEGTENVAGLDIDELEDEYNTLNTAQPQAPNGNVFVQVGPPPVVKLCATCQQPLPQENKTETYDLKTFTSGDFFKNKIRMEELTEQITRRKNRQDAENNVITLEATINTLKQLETWLSGKIKAALRKCETDFTAKLLPFTKPNVPVLLLEVDGKATMEVGFSTDDRFTSVISGAEWCILLMALSTLTGDASSYILPEDKGWDGTTLARVLDNFTAAVQNVLITSTVEPSHIPEGWTVIRV